MKRARSFSLEHAKRQCLQRPPVACKRACPHPDVPNAKRQRQGPSLQEMELYRLRNENAACQRIREELQKQNEAMRAYVSKAMYRIQELESEVSILNARAEPHAVLRDFTAVARG